MKNLIALAGLIALVAAQQSAPMKNDSAEQPTTNDYRTLEDMKRKHMCRYVKNKYGKWRSHCKTSWWNYSCFHTYTYYKDGERNYHQRCTRRNQEAQTSNYRCKYNRYVRRTVCGWR